MSTNAEKALEIFNSQMGQEEVGDWLLVEQDRINLFADATLDHQFIHIDPEKSAQLSPFKVTIAHGFLTLSLVSYLTGTLSAKADSKAYDGLALAVNYGLNKVRFPAPVKVDSKIRARRELTTATLVNPNTVQLEHKVTIDIDGETKPGCVAETVLRFIYS